MPLTKEDKIKICNYYDETINKLHPITSFTAHPIYPNIINYGYEPTNEEKYHIDSAFEIATELTEQISTKNREDILDFIGIPDFIPNLHVHTRVLNNRSISLEDAILYREVLETVIISKPTKIRDRKSEFVFLTRCIKIKLTNNISFLLEDTLIVSYNLFEYFKHSIQQQYPEIKNTLEFNDQLWKEIKSKQGYVDEIRTKSNFSSNENLSNYLKNNYSCDCNNKWSYKGIIKIDNRKATNREENIKSLGYSLKKIL